MAPPSLLTVPPAPHVLQALQIRPATPEDAARIAQIYAPYVRDTCITFELNPPDADEMRRRIEDASRGHAFIVAERVCDDNDTDTDTDADADADATTSASSASIIGYAYASAFHPREAYRFSCSVSVYLDAGLASTSTSASASGGSEFGSASGPGCGDGPRPSRKGTGTALLQALLHRLEQRGYRQAFGLIALPNAPSVGLHEKLGFRRCALCERVGWKKGRWVDVGWWQRALGAGPEAEGPPDELQ